METKGFSMIGLSLVNSGARTKSSSLQTFLVAIEVFFGEI
jgi:hypothetical protein